jgi:hypothetical protein
MGVQYDIHIPTSASPGDCLGTFGTTLSAMGIELGTRLDAALEGKIGPAWFSTLEDLRAQQAWNRGKTYRPAYSCHEFNWIVNEAFHNSNSPIRDYLPVGVANFYKRLQDMAELRNRWFHDHNPHNIQSLKTALALALYIAKTCNLESAKGIDSALQRVNEILTGTYQNQQSDPVIQPEDIPVVTAEEEPAAARQSAVGAVWIGPHGARKLELRESGALIDTVLTANVTTELTEEQTQRYLPLWKLMLKRDWMWVDSLGQVGAYVGGIFRFMGYLGETSVESQQDPFSKFLLPHSYEIVETGLLDRESGAELSEVHLGKVTASTLKRVREELDDEQILRVTWDGDLISFTDSGPIYLGEIESSDWFAGHFAIATA